MIQFFVIVPPNYDHEYVKYGANVAPQALTNRFNVDFHFISNNVPPYNGDIYLVTVPDHNAKTMFLLKSGFEVANNKIVTEWLSHKRPINDKYYSHKQSLCKYLDN